MRYFYLSTHETDNPSKDIAKQFNWECLTIVDYISKFFTPLRRKGYKMIRVALTNDLSVQKRVEPPVISYTVVRVVMHYDIEAQYLTKSELDKKKEIVRILKEAAARAAEFMGWDFQNLETCFDNLINETNYCFVEKLNKLKKTPDKTISACIKREIGVEKLKYFLETKKKKEHKYIPILSINCIFELLPFFGQAFFIIYDDGDWISNKIYQVSNVGRNIFYKIDVENDHCDISYLPSSEDELSFLKGKMALATADNIEEKSILIEKWAEQINKEVNDALQKRFEQG